MESIAPSPLQPPCLRAANFQQGHHVTLVILLSVCTFEARREMVAACQWASGALT